MRLGSPIVWYPPTQFNFRKDINRERTEENNLLVNEGKLSDSSFLLRRLRKPPSTIREKPIQRFVLRILQDRACVYWRGTSRQYDGSYVMRPLYSTTKDYNEIRNTIKDSSTKGSTWVHVWRTPVISLVPGP